MAAEWEVGRLNDNHEWDEFSCGVSSLDSFLQKDAEEYDRQGVCRLWVANLKDDPRIAGYYACSAGVFQRDRLPKVMRQDVPLFPVPTVHLGRLAVDRPSQGKGLGEYLLYHFFEKTIEAAEILGIYAVDVQAVDEGAKNFYRHYDFIDLVDSPLHLFLPIKTIREMFEG